MLLKKITSRLVPTLPFKLAGLFSKRAKNAQLILHSPQHIQQMVSRKEEKERRIIAQPKPWKRGVEGESRFRVSLVGLPNCGKSSLFNCLIGERIAIVDPERGTTRDRKQFPILDGLVSVIDTPGVETNLLKKGGVKGESLKEQIFKQCISAIHESHLIIMVIDAKKTVTRDEIELAQYLKAFGKHAKIVLVANKCDGIYDEGEVYGQSALLGLGEAFTVSAEEGTGVIQLLNFINDSVPQEVRTQFESKRLKRIDKFEELVKKLKEEIRVFSAEKEFKVGEWEKDFRRINPNPEDNQALDGEDFQSAFIRPEQAFSNTRGAELKNLRMAGTIKISLIGRPNVGKSSLINQLIGEEKVVVSQTPHTTRDSIRSRLEYKSRKIQLIDTAGLNTPNINENDEEYLRKVQISTMAHVQESHVVVYVMDAFSALVLDDFALIRSVLKEGRPVIIAVNKWEAIKEEFRYKAKNYLLKQIEKQLGELHGNPLVFVSAKMGTGLEELLSRVLDCYDKWNTRISTGMLNDWLDNLKKLQELPKDREHSLRINYMIQARVRPPHFIFFLNSKELFEPYYERFLLRNLAKEFKMDGVPLRLTLRSTNNRENKRVKRTTRKQSQMRERMQQLKNKYGNLGL